MPKLYEVIKIDELSRLTDTQGIERYYRHRIRTKGGTVLTEDIDEKDFTPEKVSVILAAKAENADKILAL